ncbi:MAG TPA: hypothetical protein VMW95_04925, partial [Desulfobacterales bacterium]|nr:hypothetical protein [Desulfobacterales bacterium]
MSTKDMGLLIFRNIIKAGFIVCFRNMLKMSAVSLIYGLSIWFNGQLKTIGTLTRAREENLNEGI